ncbi:DUF1385 domain-containing protein, partial [bacterium]|nr:DUF1385 domain-containing protein [bacterium]
VWDRVLVHLPLIPVMAGLAYEVLRIAEKNAEKPAWRAAVLPGFWLQRITTREPDDGQVDVALAALHESLVKDASEYEGEARGLEVRRGGAESDVQAVIRDEKNENQSHPGGKKLENAESAA